MKLVSLLLFMLVISSCGAKKKKLNNENDLYGRWDITDAIRNGRHTTTLKGGYLRFLENGILETNLLGDTIQSNFEIAGGVITSSGNFPYKFYVENLTQDSLVLSGRMKVFDMVFLLEKGDDTIINTHSPGHVLDQEEKMVN